MASLEEQVSKLSTNLKRNIQVPTKVQAQVLLDVYENNGKNALTAYRLPLLTWKQSEELKAAHRHEALPGMKTDNPSCLAQMAKYWRQWQLLQLDKFQLSSTDVQEATDHITNSNSFGI